MRQMLKTTYVNILRGLPWVPGEAPKEFPRKSFRGSPTDKSPKGYFWVAPKGRLMPDENPRQGGW